MREDRNVLKTQQVDRQEGGCQEGIGVMGGLYQNGSYKNGCECEKLHWFHSGQGLLVDHCECSTEPLGFISYEFVIVYIGAIH